MTKNRKLFREDIAEMLGIQVRSMGRVKLPERDGTEVEAGHARPWWWASTIEAWLPTGRPGKGWRKGKTGPVGPDSGDSA